MEYQPGIVLSSLTMQVLEYWFREAHQEFSRVIPLLISSPDVFHVGFFFFPQTTCVIFGNDVSTCKWPMNMKKPKRGLPVDRELSKCAKYGLGNHSSVEIVRWLCSNK